jgi:hypothetical protein
MHHQMHIPALLHFPLPFLFLRGFFCFMLDTSLRQPPVTSHRTLSVTKTKAKPLQKISNSFTLNHENAESKLDNLHLYPHIRMSSTCTIKDRLAMANLVKEFDRDQLDGFKKIG